ncbi:MAG: flagellar filament capping protein FliD, partial [Tissierellia bacterium]|nr:flagellar filament capping protein FliD [Tissierellia bacterium]
MSTLRISGLASGMDTDLMVESLMKVERLKVDRFEQNKQIALWRQEAYNNMNKLFANFILNTRKNMGLTRTTSTGIALSNSYTSIDYLRRATSSNENVATVSSTSQTVNGSFSIKVEKLATSESITSAQLSDGDVVDGMKFMIKGEADGEFKTITVKGSTMSDVVNAINASKDESKVVAFYDSVNHRLFLQSTVTGANSEIQLLRVDGAEGESGNAFLENLSGEGFNKTNGQNAEINYNGVKLTYSSNNINFNGLNIELKSEGNTTLNVSTNIDGIMEKIEQFINDYNELIDKASKAVNEKRYPSYHPLSQEEKKAMHEDDVKLWEEKARSGMLSRDELITRTLLAIRTDLYRNVGGVSGSFKNLIEIGITTESYTRGTTGGKLQIDKEKLRAAIEKDPEGVMELLFKEPEKLDRADFPDT